MIIDEKTGEIEHEKSVKRLTKDIADAAMTLTDREARYLVDAYYAIQKDRIRAGNQTKALSKNNEPNLVIAWLQNQSETLENQIKRALDKYSRSTPIGEWARSIVGIGPVLAAGLMAHISVAPWRCRADRGVEFTACKPDEPCTDKCDYEIIETAGHIWRFAGLDPTSVWDKGGVRPWNARLKTICWKIGESFVKVKAHKEDIYGKMYDVRKAFEHEQNDKGAYAEQAAAVLKSCPSHAQKKTYAEGKLPDGHLHARAKRYAVKMFLSHYHHVAYVAHFGREPPLPFPIAILGHAHYIKPTHLSKSAKIKQRFIGRDSTIINERFRASDSIR